MLSTLERQDEEKVIIGSHDFKLCFLFEQVDTLSSEVKAVLIVLDAKV